MKKRTNQNMPIGRLKRIKDFLPAPGKAAKPGGTTKITKRDYRSRFMSLLRGESRKRKKINFLINPTVYSDYDVIAVGQIKNLKKFCKNYKSSHFVKQSIWRFPLVIVDTFDDINEALDFIRSSQNSSYRFPK